MNRWITVLSAALLFLLCVPPVLGAPDAVSYEQNVTLIHDQDGEGDCVGYSATHVLEVQKEMELAYSPDPSFAFLEYVFKVKTAGGSDPRVVQPGSTWETILSNYGLPPETSYPTNFDAIGSARDPPTLFSHPPSDTAFTEAQAYRLSGQVESLSQPSIAQTEDWLATKGPLVCHNLFDNHTVALIGYNRSAASGTGEFTIIDSANWLGIGTAAIKRAPYALYTARKPYMTIQYAPNVETPLVHPYTARIRVSHTNRRSLLTVKIGAVGHNPVTVWDRNNFVNRSDWGSDLAIDVPLPSYAAEHWPPSDQNRWYVQVTNHDTSPNNAFLQEVTLVKRVDNPSPLADQVDVYSQVGLPRVCIAGTTSDFTFPARLTVTSPNGGDCWDAGQTRTVTWTQSGLAGSNVRVDLFKGTSLVPSYTIAPVVDAGAGSVTWQVPAGVQPGTDYRVQVQSLFDGRVLDRSDGAFCLNPAASFTADPVSGLSPHTVKFTDTSMATPIAWHWSFGDGQTSETSNPSHSYMSAGTYSVTLTVTYPGGFTKRVTRANLVTVYQSLYANFEPAAGAGYEPFTVRFTDTTTGNPTSWHWDFGDGETSTEQHPTHTFEGALSGEALYTVVLTVSNPYDTKTATHYIRVLPLYGGKIQVEAEDYDPGGEGVGYHDTTAGNSGGAYRGDDVDIVPDGSGGWAVSEIQNNEWTQYTVLNPGLENATVPFSIRAASSFYYNTVRVRVNGEDRGTLSVPYTQSISTYGWSHSSLTLKPGWNTIRLEYLSSVSGSTMSFDYFTLDPSGIRVLTVVPGASGLPTATGGGAYNDVNGNGRKDFADVVLYFSQMAWIAANEPLSAFDYNGNGRIDFSDVVSLFNHL